ncbi:hypothetical protein B0H34DRAFT_314943 [Crassisporium funariophilum]|nr:hypothetical protein B0H34DRAFT_314943 [Crassisporium funariophilum]
MSLDSYFGHLLIGFSIFFFAVASYAILFSTLFPLTGIVVCTQGIVICPTPQHMSLRSSMCWQKIPTTNISPSCLYPLHHILSSQTG